MVNDYDDESVMNDVLRGVNGLFRGSVSTSVQTILFMRYFIKFLINWF